MSGRALFLILSLSLVARDGVRGDEAQHWSFRPIPKPTGVDATTNSASAIDAFIDRKLAAADLRPAEQANRHTLLRRLSIDLLGLPPTRQEIDDFVSDPAPDAYERLVDRLLAKPQFGERQARHWLDLVRFTETAGHVQDRVRPNAWRYRDYVVDAFNSDLPYERFVLEHLAGDALEARTGSRGEDNISPAATGFLWFHEMHFRPVHPVVQRADQIDAQIDVVGKAFLGLTISCARCHDHKFDAISQKEYFALAGILNSSVESHASLTRADLAKLSDTQKVKVATLRKEIDEIVAAQTRAVRSRQSNKTKELVPLTETNFDPDAQGKLAALRRQLAELHPDLDRWAPSARDARGRDMALHVDGDPTQIGELVPRGFLASLSETPQPKLGEESGRRWLADQIAKTPLAARVMANRLWQHHFGRGLVTTPNNFGRLADPPSHPDLLDYLAHRLTETKGSLKTVHREIVLSRVYRRSSQRSEKSRRVDPSNRWLQARDARRLEAEALRDALLALSGRLDSAMGGPGIPPHISPNATANKRIHIPKTGPLDGAGRRSIYVLVRRNFVTPFLQIFDFPNQGESVAVRNETVSPSQSLAILNSPFVHQQMQRWSANLIRDPASDLAKIDRLFLEALSRRPSPRESEYFEKWLHDSRAKSMEEIEIWAALAHITISRSEFLFVR